MTARRSSSTKRRHTGIPRGAAAAVILAGCALPVTGCASQPSGSGPTTLPGNQDTAAAFAVRPPAARAAATATPSGPVPLTRPFTTAATSYPGPGSYSNNDSAAITALGADVVRKTPPLTASPTVNPVDPTPRLEIVGMPMWLWVNPVYESVHVPYTGQQYDDVVTVRTVVDSITWFSDADGTALTCSNTPPVAPLRGPGTPYSSGMDPAGTSVVDACVTKAPTTPLYTTTTNAAGQPVTTAAVNYFTARVTWHAEYAITTADQPPPTAGLAPAGGRRAQAFAIGTWSPVPGQPPTTVDVGQAPLAFRVGEIQALVTGP